MPTKLNPNRSLEIYSIPFSNDRFGFIEDYNFLRWKDVFTTGLRVFMDGIDGATSVA